MWKTQLRLLCVECNYYYALLKFLFIIGYNEKSDIYSVGMVVCELANGAEPFAGVSTTLMLTEKVRGCTPQLLDCTTLSREHTEVHGGVLIGL